MSVARMLVLGPQVMIIVLEFAWPCLSSPPLPVPSTSRPNLHHSEHVTEDGNFTLTTLNTTSSRNGEKKLNRINLATTLLLRISIIALCIVTFVLLVRLSEIINRKCLPSCGHRQELHFTRI